MIRPTKPTAFSSATKTGVSTGGKKPEGVAVELADAVIRIADLCGHLGIDLEAAIDLKMAYNETRPFKHGKRF